MSSRKNFKASILVYELFVWKGARKGTIVKVRKIRKKKPTTIGSQCKKFLSLRAIDAVKMNKRCIMGGKKEVNYRWLSSSNNKLVY